MMAEDTQTVELPSWLYDDLKALAEEARAESIAEVIADLVARARDERHEPAGPPTPAFRRILERATDLGVPDLSERHGHYL